MFAVVQSGGKQYRVREGDTLRLESIQAEAGDSVELPVLMLGNGSDIRLGENALGNAKVTAEVVEHGRGEKLRIYKFKAKSNYRRQTGHRQAYTEVRITGIVS